MFQKLLRPGDGDFVLIPGARLRLKGVQGGDYGRCFGQGISNVFKHVTEVRVQSSVAGVFHVELLRFGPQYLD